LELLKDFIYPKRNHHLRAPCNFFKTNNYFYRPVTYEKELIHEEKNKYKQIAMGYGTKISLKTSKADQGVPGPAYKTEYHKSIQ